jgi:hypothetical protein
MELEQYVFGGDADIARIKGELFRGQLDDSMIQAALDISTPTLNRYVSNGMPCYRIGRRRLFDIEAVRYWMLSHQQNAPARSRGRPRKLASSR